MDELTLFEEGAPRSPNRLNAPASSGGGGNDAGDRNAPLAARMRPRGLSEFRGQEKLLAEGRALRAMIDGGRISSMILWGPPGSGKTTLARILASAVDATFVPFSAVTEGVARVREIIAEATVRRKATGRGTILFCDEIHRFNKGQQDAFLPHVEAGTIVLIGATTENPSFQIVRPLLSRAPVYVLEALSTEALTELLAEAWSDRERGLGRKEERADRSLLSTIATQADGDARRALGILERASELTPPDEVLATEVVREAVQHRFAVHDRDGEEHFNQLSAYHKSLRGSDPDGALYWMARMLEGGEDPLVLFRRAIAMAAEDIGLADPRALSLAVTARDAFQMLGAPEGYLPLAEMTVYLATAPKSNAVKRALDAALDAARRTPGAPVPVEFRNAATGLMKDLGYGKGYRYDHDADGGHAGQDFLPRELAGERIFEAGSVGYEATIAARLSELRACRERNEDGADSATDSID